MRTSSWLFLFLFFLLIPHQIYGYTEDLDEASPGLAGPNNALFSKVLEVPVTDSSWEKIDANLYLGPTGQLYHYDNNSGEITSSTSVVVDNKTYGEDGRLLKYYTERLKDGKVIGYNWYYNPQYDESGRLIGYTRLVTDIAGNQIAAYDYSNMVYHANGRLASYDRVDRGADNTKKYEYSFTYNDAGQRTAMIQSVFSTDGELTRVRNYSEYQYDEQGRTAGYGRVDTDNEGNVLKKYRYSEIAYYDDGSQKGYKREDFDDQGNLLRSYSYDRDEDGKISSIQRDDYNNDGSVSRTAVYDGYEYDSDGRTLGYNRVERDGEGNIITDNRYSDITYNENGTQQGYKLETRDANNSLVRTYEYEKNESGKVSSISRIDYGESGEVESTHIYTGYSYDSQGRTSSYVRTDSDGGGNVTASYSYSDFNYYSNGRQQSFQMDKRNESGVLESRSQYGKNDQGQLVSVHSSSYDSAGSVTGRSEYYDYQYYGDGTRSGYTRVNTAGDGTFSSRYVYSNFQYNPDGSVLSYDWTTTDESGQVQTGGGTHVN